MEKTTLELQTAKKRSQLAMIWHRLTKNKLAVIGLIIIVTMIVASIAIGFTVEIAAAHPAGKDISLEGGLSGITTAVHPGAARYYEEKGITVDPGLLID